MTEKFEIWVRFITKIAIKQAKKQKINKLHFTECADITFCSEIIPDIKYVLSLLVLPIWTFLQLSSPLYCFISIPPVNFLDDQSISQTLIYIAPIRNKYQRRLPQGKSRGSKHKFSKFSVGSMKTQHRSNKRV